MITKRDIIKMVKAIYRHDRGLPPRRLIYPAREWGIGILGAFAVLIMVFVVSATVYVSLDGLQERIETPSVRTVVYEQATAERVLEQYTERANRYAQLANDYGAPAVQATSSPATSTPAVVSDIEPAEEENIAQSNLEVDSGQVGEAEGGPLLAE